MKLSKDKCPKFVYFSLIAAFVLSSCTDVLDLKPLNNITPEVFLSNETELSMYTINLYANAFPGFYSNQLRGSFPIERRDNDSDNQVTAAGSLQYWVKGEWRVPSTDDNWGFGRIRTVNYFIENVNAKLANNENLGAADRVNYHLGEAYFFRAWEYFAKLRRYGDFPIITTTLKDNEAVLIEASKRVPRNEVARFILQDLDSAALLMGNTQVNGSSRLSKKVVQLVKSRVALYEGSWLKYFAGTPFIPGSSDWPGSATNPGFQIDLEGEVSFFLTQAMEAAKEVADAYPLTENSGRINPPVDQPWGWNPYYEMFCANDMGSIPEILLWRDYSRDYADFTHGGGFHVFQNQNIGYGFTREYIDGFLMKNGLPIYADNAGYQGDTEIWKQKAQRDDRLQLFVWGEKDTLRDFVSQLDNLDIARRTGSITGFHYRKFGSYDPYQSNVSTSVGQDFPAPIFRSVEALLNYIEASYMLHGTLDGVATDYWQRIRRRAGVSDDLQLTIANTDLSKEADWAKYSGNSLVDATLFNIRRERRNEFISEGMRWDDLRRWKALDMVKDHIVEGINLWDVVYASEYYDDPNYELVPSPGTGSKTPNVSGPSDSKYVRPYRIFTTNNQLWSGFNWSEANYLHPLPYLEFQLTSTDPNQINTSVLYQNPHWPVSANGVAIK